MNTQESQYLFKRKLEKGETEKQAYQEIFDLKQSQKLFKKLSREIKSLKKELNKSELDNKKLKDKIKESKQKEFLDKLKNQKDKPLVQVESHTKQATITHASRIINFTEVGKQYTKSDLAKMLVIPTSMADMLLLFLNRYTNTKFEKKPDCKWLRVQ